MKKSVVLSVIIIGTFGSCKKETTVISKEDEKKIVVVEPVSQECYIAIMKKDTIQMSLNIKGNKLETGKLDYILFEKDKNQGTLSGEIKGDTLFADYTFMSEGVSSVREVAFLKRGDNYIEGFGEVIDNNKGKVSFKNRGKLSFNNKMILTKVDCK